jgi:hypothetical protein
LRYRCAHWRRGCAGCALDTFVPCCCAANTQLQALCRSEVQARPCPQLVLACCTALVTGGGITTQAIFKHNPPQELVDRLAATAAGGTASNTQQYTPHGGHVLKQTGWVL